MMAACIVFVTCRKPYEPPIIKTELNLLVVDGTVICGPNARTTITLSRTTRLGDSLLFHPELFASVTIEQEQGASYLLQEQGEGIYISAALNLDPQFKYRVRIRTNAGKEYMSAYTPGKIAPPIDSLTWKQDGDVIVSVHTHDPNNNTRYYRWDYIETWNYTSQLHTQWGVENGMIFLRDSTTQIDSCWRNANSTNLTVGTSIALGEDVISYQPVARIPQNAEKISMGYSILMRQYGITEDAFRYYQLIQKNTQQIGTLFDAQPSQLEGNIQSVTDPGEPVIGFVVASTVTEKRIFIRNESLVDWHYLPASVVCNDFIYVAVNQVDYRIYTFPNPNYAPYYFITQGPLVVAQKSCLDCRESGGTNTKPSFWNH
jgi:hypothetical protein